MLVMKPDDYRTSSDVHKVLATWLWASPALETAIPTTITVEPAEWRTLLNQLGAKTYQVVEGLLRDAARPPDLARAKASCLRPIRTSASLFSTPKQRMPVS